MPAGYVSADVLKGGRAFSEWFVSEAGGLGTYAAYTSLTVGNEFARCKSCHGWDGLGSAGSYAARTGQSTGTGTRPDVSGVNLRTASANSTHQELFDNIIRPSGRFINSPDSRHPDYTAVLTDAQLWDLVKFMREGWMNSNDLYDMTIVGAPMYYGSNPDGGTTDVLVKPTVTYANIGKSGVASAGATAYATKCASCHGANGKQITVDGAAFAGVGGYLRAKPNEAWFKIKFGRAGMAPGLVSTTAEMQDMYKALADTALFPD